MSSRVAITTAIAFSVFSKQLFNVRLGGSDVDSFQIGLAVWGLLAYGATSRLAINVLLVWAGVLGASYTILSLHGYQTSVLIRQGVPAAAVYAGVAALLEKTSAQALADSYLKVSFWVAALGLVQFFLSLGGVVVMMKTAGRLDSIVYEPSHYAIAIGPAAFVSVSNLVGAGTSFLPRKYVRELVIIASVLATLSLSGLLILVFCVVLRLLNRAGILYFMLCIGIGSYLYFNPAILPDEIRVRVEAMQEVADSDIDAFKVKNLSIYSALTNLQVATSSFEKGRIFGNGFGGHVGAYAEYVRERGLVLDSREGFNVVSAHSLAIRVFSEFGLAGALLYGIWIFKGVVARNDPSRIWWTLSAVYFFGRMFKLGGFFEVGMPVFLLAPLVFHGWSSAVNYYAAPLPQPAKPHATP